MGVGYRKQLLSFIYSEDLAHAIFLLLEKGLRATSFWCRMAIVIPTASSTPSCKRLKESGCCASKFPFFWFARPPSSAKGSALLGKATAFNSDKYHIMKQRNWACDISRYKKAVGFQNLPPLKGGWPKPWRGTKNADGSETDVFHANQASVALF